MTWVCGIAGADGLKAGTVSAGPLPPDWRRRPHGRRDGYRPLTAFSYWLLETFPVFQTIG
jgi:hypothetical protein